MKRNVVHQRSRLIAASAALVLLLAAPRAASAQNVCGELLYTLTLPNYQCMSPDTPEHIAHCFLNPACCTSGLCRFFPDCYIEMLQQFAAGTTYCDFTGDEFLARWFANQVRNPALPTETMLLAFDSYVASVAAQGSPIPSTVRQTLKDLIAPIYDNGAHGYSYYDVDTVKIINSSNIDANKAWNGSFGGVTLGPVIILRDDLYNSIMSLHPSTLAEVQWGYSWDGQWQTYVDALETLVHEMNHVGQFRRYGSDTFRVAYLWNYIYDGYSLSPYEDESYTFSANLSMVNGGQYCEGTRSIHEYQDSVRVLPYTYSCTPSQGAGALQVSELKDMSAKVSWSTNLAVTCQLLVSLASGAAVTTLQESTPTQSHSFQINSLTMSTDYQATATCNYGGVANTSQANFRTEFSAWLPVLFWR